MPPAASPLDPNVMSSRLEAQARYEKFVAEARALLMSRGAARLRLCEIAIAACDIVCGGGGHWNGHADLYTLKRFAADIKVSYKALYTWVRTKRRVYDLLPPADRAQFSWTAGEKCLRGLASDAEVATIRESYRASLQAMRGASAAARVEGYAKSIESNIRRASEGDLAVVKAILLRLVEQIEARQNDLALSRKMHKTRSVLSDKARASGINLEFLA